MNNIEVDRMITSLREAAAMINCYSVALNCEGSQMVKDDALFLTSAISERVKNVAAALERSPQEQSPLTATVTSGM